jgi:hypothetical protein
MKKTLLVITLLAALFSGSVFGFSSSQIDNIMVSVNPFGTSYDNLIPFTQVTYKNETFEVIGYTAYYTNSDHTHWSVLLFIQSTADDTCWIAPYDYVYGGGMSFRKMTIVAAYNP